MRRGAPSRDPRACDARDGAVAKRRTGEAGCGTPGRAYKGAPPTPIFRGTAPNKVGGQPAAVLISCVRDRSPPGPGPAQPGPVYESPAGGRRPPGRQVPSV